MKPPFPVNPDPHRNEPSAQEGGETLAFADDIARWMSEHILPHEGDVRRWLRRTAIGQAEEDDLIQEAYCRLASAMPRQEIRSGRAYFFTTAKNLVFERLRREKIVRIDVAEHDFSCIEDIEDTEPSPERFCSARQQLALVHWLIEELPEPCRSIFKLRKIENLSQRQAATRLGLSENIIEKQTARGLRLVLQLAQDADLDIAVYGSHDNDAQRNKRRDRRGRS